MVGSTMPYTRFSFPIIFGMLFENNTFKGSRELPRRCATEAWPLPNLVTKAFIPPFSSPLKEPEASTFAFVIDGRLDPVLAVAGLTLKSFSSIGAPVAFMVASRLPWVAFLMVIALLKRPDFTTYVFCASSARSFLAAFAVWLIAFFNAFGASDFRLPSLRSTFARVFGSNS